MGLRGPAPQPTAVRVANGNPSKRPLPAHEPGYRRGIPDQPAGMSAAAKKHWDMLTQAMVDAGVLRLIDGSSLANLCEDMALLEQFQRGFRAQARDAAAKAKVQKKKIPGGAIAYLGQSTAGRRMLASIRLQESAVRQQLREFGLTPSSASKVEAGEPARKFDAISTALTARKNKPQPEPVN